MDSGKATPLHAMLSCVLFICVEVLRDNVFATLALFSKGMNLLKQFSGLKFSGEEQRIMDMIRLMFVRLGVLAEAFGYALPLEIPSDFVVAGQRRVFADLADARSAMSFIMGDSHSFLRAANAYKVSLTARAAYDSPFLTAVDHHILYWDGSMSETGHAVLPATFNICTGDLTFNADEGTRDNASEKFRNFFSREEKDLLVRKELDDFSGGVPPSCDCVGGDECTHHWKFTQSMFTYLVQNHSCEMNAHAAPSNEPILSLEELSEQQRQLELRLGQWYDALH